MCSLYIEKVKSKREIKTEFPDLNILNIKEVEIWFNMLGLKDDEFIAKTDRLEYYLVKYEKKVKINLEV